MESNSADHVSPDAAARALADAEDTHRRAAHAGIDPWWTDALAAAGMAVMAVGFISRTLWGTLLGAFLFVVGSLVFTARQRRRGTVHDTGSVLNVALMFGGVYAVTYAAGLLIPERPTPLVLLLGALALSVVGFVFLRLGARRAARRLVETQGRTRSLS